MKKPAQGQACAGFFTIRQSAGWLLQTRCDTRRRLAQARLRGGVSQAHMAGGLVLALVVGALLWLATGFYIVDEGKRGIVRAKPPLPALEGFMAKPTVVNNVISLASVPVIFEKGAEHYKNFGLGRSRGTIPLQIAGNVKHGGLYEIAFGLTLGEIVDKIAGGTASGRPVKAVQVGGPLGAYFPRSLFDTPFGYEEFAGKDGLIGHAGLTVFDDSADMLGMARFAMEFCAIESCGKCTPCRIGAVRGVETLDRIARGDADAKPLLTDLCNTMKSGSLCALGGFTPYPVMSALTHFPDDFNTMKEAAE